MTRTKQAIIDDLYALLGSPPPQVSTGSTEPKQVFEDTITKLVLPISPSLSKPELGKAITAAAGILWTHDCDSTNSPSGGGSTVTATGLHRLLQSVQVLMGRRPSSQSGAPTVLGVPYCTPIIPIHTSSPQSRPQNLDALDRATAAHHAIQDRVAALVRSRGRDPLSPAPWDPQFDLAWRSAHGLVVCEVKTGDAGGRQQLRLGLGQVAEYRQVLRDRGEHPIIALLTMEHPSDALGLRVARALGIELTSSPSLSDDVSRWT